MPNRILRRSIKRSRTLSNLTAEAFRHWTLCLTEADDHGCFEATPEILAGSCYPYNRQMTPEIVATLNAELETSGIIKTWTEDGHDYAMFTKWDKWNSYCTTDNGKRTRHRRRTPEPPTDLLTTTHTPKKTKPEPTGARRSQYVPIPTPNPIPNPTPKPTPSEVTRNSPQGTVSVFDVEGEIQKLLARYYDPEELDPKDDIPAIDGVLKVILHHRDGRRKHAISRQKILRELAKYDIGQVVKAAYVFHEQGIASKIQPNRLDLYFCGMVRKDAGRYQSHQQRKEIADEQIQQRERKAQQDEIPVRAGNKSRPRSARSVGDVLRELPEVRGVPTDRPGQTPTHEANGET